MSKRPERTSAEWTTFAVAVAILVSLMGAIISEALRSEDDAQPVAAVERTHRVGDDFHVTVSVENKGDRAAEAVQVVASLEIAGEATEGDQTVDFLAGGDVEELVFVFADDPASGDLSVKVSGFTVP